MDDKDYIQLLERIVKATVDWDKVTRFSTDFLKSQDNCELVIRQIGNVTTIKTKFITKP